MDPSSITALTSLVDVLWRGGAFAALVFFVVASYKRFIVWGYQLDDSKAREAQMRQERDEWKHLVMEGRELVDRAVSVAASSVQQGGTK